MSFTSGSLHSMISMARSLWSVAIEAQPDPGAVEPEGRGVPEVAHVLLLAAQVVLRVGVRHGDDRGRRVLGDRRLALGPRRRAAADQVVVEVARRGPAPREPQ